MQTRKANFLNLTISILFIAQPIFSAEIIVDRAANGVPVINIARPNTNGVSHNTYIEFNVPTQGTILNNSDREVNTQLAGYIYGNENVRNGSASLILNEVSGTNRSRLNGYLEVAGQSADVIVANPNGITVNGAGFINIPKVTLTTGRVSFSGNRPIYDIERGDILIDGKGLDAKNSSSLELYTQAIKLNAKLYANDLKVVTGVNHIDKYGKVTSRDSEDENRPLFSIDSTALGGIYANAISLVGTQKGVGVNLPSEMLVQDRLEISADGKIILGKVSVKNSATIRSHSSSIKINEGVHADTLGLQALTYITLSGNTGASNDLTLLGSTLDNDGLLAAGVNSDFTESISGTLDLGFSESINNEGVFYGLDGIEIDTKKFTNAVPAEVITQTLRLNAAEALENEGKLRSDRTTLTTQTLINEGSIYANDMMHITADNFDNSEGVIEGLDTVTLNIANAFMNHNGTLFSHQALILTVQNVNNIDGIIQSNDTLTLSASGDIDNTRGTLYSGTGTTVNAQRLNNEEGFIASMKTIFLDLFRLNGDNGGISGEGVSIHTENIESNHATIQSSDGLDVVASGEVTLTNSAMLSNDTLNFTAGDTTLHGSTLYSGQNNINLDTAALNAENVYMEAKHVFSLNAAQNVNISDSTIKGSRIHLNTLEDLTADHSNMVADNDLTIGANTLNYSNGQVIAAHDLTVTLEDAFTQYNSAFIAYNNTAVSAEDHTLTGASTLYASNAMMLDITNTLNTTEASRILSDNTLSINAQTLNLDNASLFAQHKGSINTAIFNNINGVVSAAQMNIHTTTFNNADSQFYSDGGTLNITASGTMNNNNGLISANGDLLID
ncbi:MAG: hypothetical protein DRG09_03835, partial [Epsilonproteobacteria bacterium]